MIKIALVGNPNCGKTSLFNALTGANQYVGNWPGVTVEKKEGKMKNQDDVVFTDLPGIYSLSPYTPEEIVARNYLVNEKPDAVLNIVDGTNLERNLYLTTQVCEIGVPVIMAINMMDVVRRRGDEIHTEEIAEHFGCTVFEVSALKGTGIKKCAKAAIDTARSNRGIPPIHHSFDDRVESAIHFISSCLGKDVDERRRRYFATKIFERDPVICKQFPQISRDVESLITDVEREYDDDAEAIIADSRYKYITSCIHECVTKNKTKKSASAKIDSIVTNKFLALPIFAAIMFFVYYISVSLVGSSAVTDFIGERVFGAEGFVATGINHILTLINCAPWLKDLIINGIIAGVGSVLSFVPQIFTLFIFLSFLEDCGYMSRIAFILDKLFRKFGLSGKSFIPILIGTGCGVPGIMASRTIENEKDRRMTVMTTTFIPCGAKLPVIALISADLFGGAWWVAPSAYLLGIFSIVISGLILKKTKPFASKATPFVMELPSYHMPRPKSVLSSMWERGSDFLRKAGTIILLSSCVIWALSYFGISGGKIVHVSSMENSVLQYIGRLICFIFEPLGFGFWQAGVATIMGLLAKEGIVSVLGVLCKNASELFTQASGFSFLVFNLLCAPCVAAIGAIRREMNSPKWFAAAIAYQSIFAYAVSLCTYRFMLLFSSGEFTVGTIVAFIIALAMLFAAIAKPAANKSKTK